MKKKVLFVCGGISGEHEISLISCKNVLKAVDQNRYEARVLFISKDGKMGIVEPDEIIKLDDNPKQIRIESASWASFRPYSREGQGPCFVLEDSRLIEFDVVFPLLHGMGGEDGSIQGFFETAQSALVGSGTRASAICMDKAMTKILCIQAGLPVVPFQIVKRPIAFKDLQFSMPVFVKPAKEGSSLGVSKAKTEAEFEEALQEARRWGEKILVEPAIHGREIEIAVLDDGKERICSPAGEIVCEGSEFYSYDAKYVDEKAARLIAPAELTDEELRRVQALASRIFDCLECRGLARIDFFMTKSGEFLLNEVNTLPGFTKISMYPRLMQLAGISYSNLIGRLIESA